MSFVSECISGFAECLEHSAKPLCPVVCCHMLLRHKASILLALPLIQNICFNLIRHSLEYIVHTLYACMVQYRLALLDLWTCTLYVKPVVRKEITSQICIAHLPAMLDGPKHDRYGTFCVEAHLLSGFWESPDVTTCMFNAPIWRQLRHCFHIFCSYSPWLGMHIYVVDWYSSYINIYLCIL